MVSFIKNHHFKVLWLQKNYPTFAFQIFNILSSIMQIPKEATRKVLLETAREAFFKKGFKAVSMRELSKKTGICLSNIYKYYPGKEDLLEEVLSPLLKAMNDVLEEHDRSENFALNSFASEEYHRNSLREMMTLVVRYREELRLLFFSVQNSRFKDYWERWIERSTAMGMDYMREMGRLHPQIHTDVSPFFMYFSCSGWINMMREVVLHKELSSSDIERFIDEYIKFSSGGWIKLMNIERKMIPDEAENSNSNDSV